MSRTSEQVVWDFVQEWLAKADGDLKIARHILDIELSEYSSAGFHAQQSAEKYTKAFLVRHQVAFPKTHKMDELLKMVSTVDEPLSTELVFSVSLNPFAVEFRYPGTEDVYRELAESAVNDAAKVKDTVLAKLNDYFAAGRPE